MPRSRQKPTPKPPLQIGDYVARSYGRGNYVHLKIGPSFMDDVHVGTCATSAGAERLAALMNAARDLARDYTEICRSSPYQGMSPRDWAAHCIATSVCEALDTPMPYFNPAEEAKNSILYFSGIKHPHDLVGMFEALDSAGTPRDIDHEAARRVLLKVTTLGRRHFTEVVRAWRGSFDAEVPAADRAAKVVAELGR